MVHSGNFAIFGNNFRGIVGLKKSTSKGLSIAGIILGGIGIVIAGFLLLSVITTFSDPSFMSEFWEEFYRQLEEQGMDSSQFDEFRYNA